MCFDIVFHAKQVGKPKHKLLEHVQIHSIELDWLASKASNLIFPSIEDETNRLRLSVWDVWMTIKAWDIEWWRVHLSVKLNERERERERED